MDNNHCSEVIPYSARIDSVSTPLDVVKLTLEQQESGVDWWLMRPVFQCLIKQSSYIATVCPTIKHYGMVKKIILLILSLGAALTYQI